MPLLITEIREGGYGNIRKATKGNVEAGIKKIQDKSIVLVGVFDPEADHGIYYEYMNFKRDKKGQLPHEPDELASMRYAINSHRPSETAPPRQPPKRNMHRSKKREGFL